MKSLLPVLFIVIAGGIFFGFINPALSEAKILKEEEATYDQALSRSRELQSVRDTLLSRYNTFSTENLGRLEKAVPDTIDNVRLILDLDGIASRYGMHVRDVSIVTNAGDKARAAAGQVGTSGNAYDSLVISFSVSGTYDAFRSFLADLEQSLRLVDVNAISFTSTATGVYQYSVAVTTYWLKP